MIPQATNRKKRGFTGRAPTPPGTLLLVEWELYMTPSRMECTKTPPQTGGCSYFLIEKSPNTTFFL
jgi:hypothetical protein